MASLHKAPKSPYLYCAYTLADGTRKFRSTKKIKAQAAWKVCLAWDEAAKESGSTDRDLEILNQMRTARGRKPVELPSIRSYLENWLDAQKEHLSPSTHRRYSSSIRKLIKFLGQEADHELQTLTAEQIEQFILSEKEAGLAPKSLNLDLKAIRAALSKALKRQQVKLNVAGTVDSQPSCSAVRKAFSREQLRKLLDAASDDEWYGLIYMGYYTGLRLGDIAYLRWEEIELGQKRITVAPDKRKQKTAHLKPPLEVPIHAHLQNWLRIWQVDEQSAGSAFVFPRLSKKKITGSSGLSNTFSRLIGKASIENPKVRETAEGMDRSRSVFAYSFHSLRSTFNTELEAAGVSEEVRMKLSDHTSPSVNQLYTKPEWDRLRNEIAKLPKL